MKRNPDGTPHRLHFANLGGKHGEHSLHVTFMASRSWKKREINGGWWRDYVHPAPPHNKYPGGQQLRVLRWIRMG